MFRHNDYAGEFRTRAGKHWTDTVLFARGIGPPPRSPYQVEIHPSSHCPYRCVDCHGQFLREDRRVPGSAFLRLIDDLVSLKVPSVVISGVCTDPGAEPSLLANILRRGGPAWGVRLHINGLGLTPRVQEAIIEAAESGPPNYSYVTISKSAVDEATLAAIARPRCSPSCALDKEQRQIEEFAGLCQSRGFPLVIRLNCRLIQANASVRKLVRYLEWFARLPLEMELRITTDYEPVGCPDSYAKKFSKAIYVPPYRARALYQTAMMLAEVVRPERVKLRCVSIRPKGRASRCLFRYMFSSISSAGYVYPCPNLASARYRNLAYGDILQDSFPHIWERYLDLHCVDPISLGCLNCAAECESQINDALEEECNGGSL